MPPALASAKTPTPAPTSTPVPTNTPIPTAKAATVLPPPDSLGIDPFYEKYLDAGEIAVIGSERVPDEALIKARQMVAEMLANRPDMNAFMADSGWKVAVAADSEVLSDLPEYSSGTYEMNERVQGGGLGGNEINKTTVVWEGNLLCNSENRYRYEDVSLHEFAHSMHVNGLKLMDGGQYHRRLGRAYQDALRAGLWKRTYAATNPDEYWAEGVQSWFNVNDPPRFDHNNVNTRAELSAYDPVLAGLIDEVFRGAEITYSCHRTWDVNYDHAIEGVASNKHGRRLVGLHVNARQNTRLDSGGDETDLRGEFRIRVPDGTFTLEFISGRPHLCLGWYDGKGGITSYRNVAAVVEFASASVSGLVVEFPKSPADMPPCGENSDYKSTIERVITGPDGRPLVGVGLWAWQTTETDSGHGKTDSYGMFRIGVPGGTFRMDVTVGDPPRCAWYDGDGGITPPAERTRPR